MSNGWVGVDLDGTLAEYHGWVSEQHIGEPIPLMLERVRMWLKQGRRVKIFTARVAHDSPVVEKAIQDWCKHYIGEVLPITCKKDYEMIELWDDRAIQVIPNTGLRVDGRNDEGQLDES